MDEANTSQVEIRRLWPPDKESFRDHLLRLDARSRHERFAGGMSDDFLAQYAENCFGKGDLIYGAFVDGKMVGAAELRSNKASRRRSGATFTPRPRSRSRTVIGAAASAKNCSSASGGRPPIMASRRLRSS